jgi:hypothetical protein
VWPELPIEFNVVGTPVSLQSENARSRQEWKAKVLAAARVVVDPSHWSLTDVRLAATLYYFPQASMPGDVDNIVKLTLDALCPNIYMDDWLIDRVVVQRFEPEVSFNFTDPSPTLIAAMAADEPMLHIRINEAPLQDLTP